MRLYNLFGVWMIEIRQEKKNEGGSLSLQR